MVLTALSLRSQLLKRGVASDRLAGQVARQPALLAELFDGLNAAEVSIKYGAAKVLRSLSRSHPEILYPEIDAFIERLDSGNRFLLCDSMLALANLARVDTERRIDRILGRYFRAVQGPELMVASTAVKGGATIALGKPHLTDRIAGHLLSVQSGEFKTHECRALILGQAIDAFDRIYEQIGIPVRRLVRRLVHEQLDSERPATRKKAAKFLVRWPE